MARTRIIAGKAVIIIEAQDLVNKTLGKVRSNLHRFSNEVGKIGEGLFRTGFFGSLASGAIVSSFVKFDDALRDLRVNIDFLGASATEADTIFASLEKRIRALAQTTPFNPTQVAEAATDLAKGGFNPKEIEESLEGVLDLARATGATLPESVNIVVRSMRTFGITTDKSAQVVSQFVRAARKGTLDIEDLAAALTYSQGTADTLGVSLQKMLAIFTVLSNRGLVGSIAGTSTNTAFSQLVKKAQELKAVGKIELVTGIREDGREALDVVKSLERVFAFAETLSFTEQQTLFQDIFNLRGARSVAGLRKELANIEKLTTFIANANDEARKSAQFKDAGPGGALRRLTSTFEELKIVLGETTEKPVTALANAIKGLLIELGKLAQINPALTSLIILSPGILLAAGAGMIVLAKGLRIAAYSAGALKAAFAPLGRFFAKGTVAQITAASIALQRAKGPSKAPKIPRPVALTPGLATNAPIATQRANAAAQLAISTKTATVQGKLATNLQKRARSEALLSKIIARRGVASGAPEAANAARLAAQAKAAARSSRLATGAAAAARTALRVETLKTVGTGLVTFGRNTLIATKGLLTFLNTTRRFVFSTTGILTILEVLLLFGNKIPVIASGFDALGRGFSNAFKAITNVAKFAVGPIALLKASIEAFRADRADLGIKGLLTAFSSLASIIGNQLIAAWNRFKEAISPVYDFIVGLFTVIDVTVRSIVDSVSAVIGAAIATQSRLSESLTSFNFAEGGQGILSGIRTVAEAIAKFIPTLFSWVAQFAVTFSEESQKFIAALEYTFNRLDPRQNQNITELLRKTQIADIESAANLARRKLELGLEETLNKITKAFNDSSAATSAKNANQASNRSAQISNNAQTFAQQILAELRKAIPTPQQVAVAFPQTIAPQGNPLNNPSVQAIKLIADALVGSVQSTRGNLLRAGVTIEERQLEEQKKTNEILRAQARDQGVLFAP